MSEYIDIDKKDIVDDNGKVLYYYIYSTAKYGPFKPYYAHYYKENAYPSYLFMKTHTGDLIRAYDIRSIGSYYFYK
jgi:hypothetical protein